MKKFLAVLASVWKRITDTSVDAERICLEGISGINLSSVAEDDDLGIIPEFERTDFPYRAGLFTQKA